MPQTTLTLEAGSRKIHDSLCEISELIQSDSCDMPCWTILLAVRTLENKRNAHSKLLGMYQRHFSDTHWSVKIVLTLLVDRMQDDGIRTRKIYDDLYKHLHRQETVMSVDLQQRLNELIAETQSRLQLEEDVLYRMLDLLISAPKPAPLKYHLKLVKS